MTKKHEIIEKFREKLELVLDEYFPKINKESPEKIANKRGQALMLYSTAIHLFSAALDEADSELKADLREKIQNMKQEKVDFGKNPDMNMPYNQMLLGFSEALEAVEKLLE